MLLVSWVSAFLCRLALLGEQLKFMYYTNYTKQIFAVMLAQTDSMDV